MEIDMETIKGVALLCLALYALYEAVSANSAAKKASKAIKQMSDAFDAKLIREGIDPAAVAAQIRKR